MLMEVEGGLGSRPSWKRTAAFHSLAARCRPGAPAPRISSTATAGSMANVDKSFEVLKTANVSAKTMAQAPTVAACSRLPGNGREVIDENEPFPYRTPRRTTAAVVGQRHHGIRTVHRPGIDGPQRRNTPSSHAHGADPDDVLQEIDLGSATQPVSRIATATTGGIDVVERRRAPEQDHQRRDHDEQRCSPLMPRLSNMGTRRMRTPFHSSRRGHHRISDRVVARLPRYHFDVMTLSPNHFAMSFGRKVRARIAIDDGIRTA